MEEEIVTGKLGDVIQCVPNDKTFDSIERCLSIEDSQGPQEALQGNRSTSLLTDGRADTKKSQQKKCGQLTKIAIKSEKLAELFTVPDRNQSMNDDQPQLPQTQKNTEEIPVPTTMDSKYFLIGRNSVKELEEPNVPACECKGGELINSMNNMMDALLEQVAKPRDQSTLESEIKQESNLSTSIKDDIMSSNRRLEVQDDLIATAGKAMHPLQRCAASELRDDTSKSNPIGTLVLADYLNNKQKEFQSDFFASFGKTSLCLQGCEASKSNPNDTNQSLADCGVSISEQNSDVHMHEELKSFLTEQTEPDTNKFEPNMANNIQSPELRMVTVSNLQNVERENWENSFLKGKAEENQTMQTPQNPTDARDPCSATRKGNRKSFSPYSKGEDHSIHDELQITAKTKTLSDQAAIITPTSGSDNIVQNEVIRDEYENDVSTERLVQPYNMKYSNNPDEINPLYVSPKCDSTNTVHHEKLESNFHGNQMPTTSLAELNAIIRYRDDDDSLKHNSPEDDPENIQSNLSPELECINPPTKSTMVPRESIIQLDNRNQKKRKYNQNHSNFHGSDEKAGIILKALLEKRSIKNKMTISDINEAIIQGKPIPPMMYNTIDLESKETTESKELEENQLDIQKSDNQIMSWITGSHQLQKYLCWPCLLFGDNVWHIPDFWGLGDIVEAAKNHQKSETHMSAFMKFLVHESKLKREQEAQLETNLVRKRQTEHLLRLLIEITSSNVDGTPEEQAELLSMACSYNTELHEFIEEKSPDFLEDFVRSNRMHILGAIEQLLTATILEEMQNVPFVAIIFEDTTDLVDKSILAVILRYVTDSGIPKERFVKLMKMGTNRTVPDFLKTITLVVEGYQLAEKLIGFTYNGTVISPNEILIFNKTVSRIYPKARFFPYQEHNLKKIITQSLSHLPECRDFFYTIYELAAFLKTAPNVMKTLIKIKRESLKMQKRQWYLENDPINTIKHHYELIRSFCDQVMGQGFDWDSETVMYVNYFSRFLRSTNCRVLLMVISTILDAIDDLSNAMERNVDMDSWTRLLTEATHTLSNIKHLGLSKILHESNTFITTPECEDSITPELFDQIIDSTLLAMNHRCADLEMAFVGLQYIEAASNCGTDCQADFLQRIDISPENFFKLKKEAELNFEKLSLADNLEESIKRILNLKIIDSASHLLRFLQLCLTIPTKDNYSLESRPAVLRLRSYIAKNKPRKFFDLLIFMEKDALNSMQRNEEYFEFILEYCERNSK